jgi:hypothetical protein
MAIVAVFEFPTESVDKYEKVFEVGGKPTDQPKLSTTSATALATTGSWSSTLR